MTTSMTSNRVRVLPYKSASKSAKALAEALGAKRLRLENSNFVPRPSDIIINWGNSQCPYTFAKNAEVLDASNKLMFLQTMKGNGLEQIIPRFWTNHEDIPVDVYPVVCRTVLSGHSGHGIHIADTHSNLVDAPLYTQYLKKKDEYRVHVGKKNNGETVTISVQRKARRLSVPDSEVNWQVRNLDGGFVFVREGVSLPVPAEDAAHESLRVSGLDFGAVDVIWNEHEQKAYVLEINTAPGLEGTTIEDYKNFFLDNYV